LRGLDSTGLEQNQVVGSCEECIEHAGSINCREFLDYLRKKNYPHVVSQSVIELVTFTQPQHVLFDIEI
jgi:hypothetical protein